MYANVVVTSYKKQEEIPRKLISNISRENKLALKLLFTFIVECGWKKSPTLIPLLWRF